MSFRLFNSNIRLLGIAGMACLACVGISRAGDSGSQSIEVVPFRNPSLSTNFIVPDSSQGVDTRDFESVPQASHSYAPPTGRSGFLPPPGRPQSPEEAKREMEMLDRRKNWVFMTPEEMLGTDPSQDSSDKGSKSNTGGEPTTVMQRYYERLYDSDHPSPTNHTSKFDADSWTRTTNSALGDISQPPLSPFDTTANGSIFEPVHANAFSGITGQGMNMGVPSPEQVRLQEEQKTHMDDFKQMWGLDQPPAAAAVITPSPSVVVNSSASGFAPVQAAAPAKIVGFSSPGSLAQPAAAPPPSTLTSSRSLRPPHSDFAPPERPF